MNLGFLLNHVSCQLFQVKLNLQATAVSLESISLKVPFRDTVKERVECVARESGRTSKKFIDRENIDLEILRNM